MESQPKIYSRRNAIKAGISAFALGVLTSCGVEKQPKEQIVSTPFEMVPTLESLPLIFSSNLLKPTREIVPSITPIKAPSPILPTDRSLSSAPEVSPTPETEKILDLAPAVLSPELRKKYLAEGEYMGDEDLEGRVFVDQKSGAYVMLAPSVFKSVKTLSHCEEVER